LAGARGNAIITGAPPVERWASGLALARGAGARTAEDVLCDPTRAGLVADAATRLGQTLATLVNALDPEVVVIGGGLGGARRFRGMVAAVARSLIYAEETRDLDIVPAALGADAALIGAAIVAAEAWARGGYPPALYHFLAADGRACRSHHVAGVGPRGRRQARPSPALPRGALAGLAANALRAGSTTSSSFSWPAGLGGPAGCVERRLRSFRGGRAPNLDVLLVGPSRS
jgi:hypothetical protein